GFGLAGHSWEMADRSAVRLVVEGSVLPLYAGARAAAEAGVRTGGDPRNRDYLAGHTDGDADEVVEALVYDPQTSGGLLVAVDPGAVGELEGFTEIGRVDDRDPGVTLLA
ncbi:MAG: selenide, water dikinase SelD, partial [Acidimicrobiales bacterium]